jgi:hypothetical protein
MFGASSGRMTQGLPVSCSKHLAGPADRPPIDDAEARRDEFRRGRASVLVS